MKTLLIWGSHRRHSLFAEYLTKHCKVSANIRCIREDSLPPPPDWLDEDLACLWNLHFWKRDVAEKKWFGNPKPGDCGPTYITVPDKLNSSEVCKFVEHQGPFDATLICGVPIIKNPLFSLLPPWKVNLHMGLVPSWRGSVTAFWPYYMLKPQLIGVTYHVIVPEVDAGQVIHQYVPELQRGWGLHDIASAAYLGGCKEVGRVVRFLEGKIEVGEGPQIDSSLAKKGKIFLKKDWNPVMLRVVYEVFGDRIADMYLDGKLG